MAKLGILYYQKNVVAITFKPLEYPWHQWLTDISSSLEVNAKQSVGRVKRCTCEMHLHAHICVVSQASQLSLAEQGRGSTWTHLP